MANRALITLRKDFRQRGVCVHWNTEKGDSAINSFVKEAQKRMNQAFVQQLEDDEEGGEPELMKFYACLYGAIRDYLASGTHASVGLIGVEIWDGGDEDGVINQGCYTINNDYSCWRSEDSEENELISESFSKIAKAIRALSDENNIDVLTLEESKDKLHQAEALMVSTFDRIKALKFRIKRLQLG